MHLFNNLEHTVNSKPQMIVKIPHHSTLPLHTSTCGDKNLMVQKQVKPEQVVVNGKYKQRMKII